MKDFPYKYYFYGSYDSLDSDVLIQIPQELMPKVQEDRKILLKEIETKYDLSWNANLVVIENGVVVDTIYPKSWVDGVNNSLFTTYSLHYSKQVHPCPVTGLLKRNKLLAIYKAVRTIMGMLSRTEYRTTVRPILKGIHPFNLKLEALGKIDFTTIENFNQTNVNDVDIWKIIGFYLGQNISLIRDDIEIYTKAYLCLNHHDLTPFIYRKEITPELKKLLNDKIKYYINEILIPYGEYVCKDNIMECKGEVIDMKNEISL